MFLFNLIAFVGISVIWQLLATFKDTLTAFADFKNKQQKCMK